MSMCWNADISLNTFLFGVFSLCFIYLTHTYTRYKTPTFQNPWMYALVFSAVSMQWIEHFVWKNLHNKQLNVLLSKVACMVLLLQPILMMCLVPQTTLRYGLMAAYLLCGGLYLLTNPLHQEYFNMKVSPNGHLAWGWMKSIGWPTALYFLFYLTALYFIESVLFKWFFVVSLLVSIVCYFRDGTYGSMWCWMSNLLFLYFILHILVIQPFMEYNGLC